MKYGPRDKVRITMYDFGGPCSYAYGTVTFKDDETDCLYWVNFTEGGQVRIHHHHMVKASILEQLLYF